MGLVNENIILRNMLWHRKFIIKEKNGRLLKKKLIIFNAIILFIFLFGSLSFYYKFNSFIPQICILSGLLIISGFSIIENKYNTHAMSIDTIGTISIPGIFNKMKVNSFQHLSLDSPAMGMGYRFTVDNIKKLSLISSDEKLNIFKQRIAWELKVPVHLVVDTKNILCIELKEPLKRNTPKSWYDTSKDRLDPATIYISLEDPEKVMQDINEMMEKNKQ